MLPRKAKPDSVTFFSRAYPSANFAIIHGPRPIMIDSGFGSEALAMMDTIEAAGTHPRDLQCVANTHYHVDHVGVNAALQREHGVRIAAHRHDALMINAADPDACCATWLDQPVEQYQVNVYLQAGMVLETGTLAVQVLATPGHTLGHLSYLVEDGTLVAGDLFYEDDIATLVPFREGAGAIYRRIDTLNMLTDSPIEIKRVMSGHGPLITKPYEAIDRALARLDRWLLDPSKAAWHAMKRAAAYRLMVAGSQPRALLEAYLAGTFWLNDYAKYVFEIPADTLAAQLCDELLRSGAVREQGGVLASTAEVRDVPSAWLKSVPPVRAWKARL